MGVKPFIHITRARGVDVVHHINGAVRRENIPIILMLCLFGDWCALLGVIECLNSNIKDRILFQPFCALSLFLRY